jgi:hypothetical protein
MLSTAVGAVGRNLSNRIQSAYANRRSYAQSARKVIGAGRKLISAVGRTAEFANSLGVSNPQISGAVGALQKYGNPALDFADSELQRVGE